MNMYNNKIQAYKPEITAPGIEPGPLDLQPGTLTNRPQRWSSILQRKTKFRTELESLVPSTVFTCRTHGLCAKLQRSLN
jgi:hypothetical protein